MGFRAIFTDAQELIEIGVPGAHRKERGQRIMARQLILEDF